MGQARPGALLYGPTRSPGPELNWLQAPGCGFIQNRAIGDAGWLSAMRDAGGEPLYYANVMEYPVAWNPSGEEQFLYGGIAGGAANIPNSWWWTGSYASSGSRVNYSGHRMLNIRPNSPWLQYLLNTWAPAVFASTAHLRGKTNGIFWDVIGNRLWVNVWSTMAATDTYAGDGRTERENWIRGVHWFLDQVRAIFGPEVLMVANNTFDTSASALGIGKSLDQITGGYTSMQKGGHPALNGMMFEGAEGGANSGQHPVSYVNAVVAKSATSQSPGGYNWAEQAGDRRRFYVLSSKGNSMVPYAGCDWCWVGGAPNGYDTVSGQVQVAGTAKTQWPDHLVNWLWTAPGGGGGGDVTPPTAVTVLTADAPDGSAVTFHYTLPSDADRATFTLSRKSTVWGSSDTPANGTTVYTASPGAAGAGSTTQTIPDGTWHVKAFTSDAAGNLQTGGAVVDVTVQTAAQGPADAYFAHTFTGTAGAKPDQDIWTDPALTSPGVSADTTAALDGAGNYVVRAKALVAGQWASVVTQRRSPVDLSGAARRCLLVDLSHTAGGSDTSSSLYLLGPGTQGESGAGLSAPFSWPNWLRVERVYNATMRVLRKSNGTLSTLWEGTPPPDGTPFRVAILIGPSDQAVMIGGTMVVTLSDRGSAPFSQALLYLETATAVADAETVTKWSLAEMFRATPHAPGDPTATVSGGLTHYGAPAPPAEDPPLTWRWYIAGTKRAQVSTTGGTTPAATGPELPPGAYAVDLQTENLSPFAEVTQAPAGTG